MPEKKKAKKKGKRVRAPEPDANQIAFRVITEAIRNRD
jgi:hypothetical protein